MWRGMNTKPGSRAHEDEKVFAKFRDQFRTAGFFLEMGAFDGVHESNSFFFERCLGWTGLLIEANPRMFTRLKDSSMRPRAHKLHMAPSCPSPNSTVEIVATDTTMGGIMSLLPERERNADTHVSVHCGPLSLYLEELGIKYIDFFSLDVEGAELDVLETIDFNTIKVGVLMVESWNRQCADVCPKRDAVRALMAQRGATLHHIVDFSDIFTWPSSER